MSKPVTALTLLLLLYSSSLLSQESKKPKPQYRKLVEVPCEISSLSFSSNGLMLTYVCNGNIFITGLAGTSPQQITNSKFKVSKPVWSPDGTKVAYQKDSMEVSSIWVYSTISRVRTRVSKIKENCFDPSWAPNGRAIAFSTDTYGSVDVMIKEFDYNKERRLTAAKGDEYIFGFHPSGRYVGYYERGTEEEDLYAVSLTGKEALPLTRSTDLESGPKWSIDGSRAVFYIEKGGQKTIFTSDFPYGESHRIGQFESAHILPIISTNGKRILYPTQVNGETDLILHEVESKQSTPLGLTSIVNLGQPAWSIGGRILAVSNYDQSTNTGNIWLVNISQFIKTR